MPNVELTPQMEEFVEREVAAGAYGDVGEVVREAMRRLMEERGAADFFRLRRDLVAAAAEPTEEFDPREFEPRAFR
jgi:antitoxin ParD1/3/4